MTGEWTHFRPCTSKECSNLEKVLGVDICYQPLSVATQTVAGTNYCFYCNGKVIAPDSPDKPYKIYTFQPLGSDEFDPTQVEIEELPLLP
ncbi:hypothetical protein [Halodesulfovibrio spirochaetisodalis]|uniref:Uncharacterized protein n=1 Tax=Halodesulfovibrio spirochaetisodalis TaxID=1560234 RepID=A0A1B7XBI2_9BACT|nr:hypothetical protein [Halodesulfovibrio spirochaetisodalis]OBQ46696.1 hypothetical protein SP90_11270 [Halodesulfovibrio spirochaetisodalis]